VNTKHVTLTLAFAASFLGPASVSAQDSFRITASQEPAKSSELISTLEGSAAAYASNGSMTQAFSGPTPEADEPCVYCRGRFVEALLRWTERLVTSLDPIGVVETPFDPAVPEDSSAPAASPPEWRPIPRFKPVQLHGGYGLVARISF